jgi:GMP synthase (glutamine-hydrolysing)
MILGMSDSPLRAMVLSHVGFEDLGTLRAPLLNRGFTVDSVEVASTQFPFASAADSDLLVVLGGPIGVYDQGDYPFLKNEITAISNRLDAGKPTLGICLGAQLMAAALGAPVYPGKNEREIGWAPIKPAPQTKLPEWFKPLVAPGLNVLHWHGDTFDLPAGATLLASTENYVNQAFTYRASALALQFHPEVTAFDLESWYVGHAAELDQAGLSIRALRAAAELYAPQLEIAAREFWNQWLDYIL